MSRRAMLGAIATSPLWMQSAWAQPNNLKISHQFPGGSIAEGDFRDRLCRMFAANVERRTRGGLKFSIYPSSSLMAPNAQFAALRSGGLDMALVPLSYAGAEAPEANIGLMPGLVTSYEQGYGWKNAPVGKELTRILHDQGLVVISWIWQAGGVASRGKPIVHPEDVAGLKVRGGSHEMDRLLADAGATVVNMPSNEIQAAMRAGSLDAALTSSTSLISFRLQESARALTTARGGAYWFMFEPLMMSRTVFDRLSKQQQAAVMAVGAELEGFARKAARADDAAVAAVYAKTGAQIVDMNAEALRKWQAVARTNAWREYAERSANCAKLLQLAEQSIAMI
ncbi:TRAP transporter substrate-binding protein DctP [Massilia sp. IC2-476]|uniref:TRAP transporter substrate-binding protein DctP n=1 Tax=Massilia sp. IC2-476 TaxID=2887199 RepID=UPI001D0FD423|nr:TRAP transporter substrate-binding protein DctP [Massilia sp. IC2-476]MCC2974453.1 TRAP transporter substrate-binding protein DctP [Massilia sp. IC2-476]